jgi:hypothetical protein
VRPRFRDECGRIEELVNGERDQHDIERGAEGVGADVAQATF